MGGLLESLFAPYDLARVEYGDSAGVPVSSIWVAEATGDRTLLSTAASFDGPKPDSVDLGQARAVLCDGFYPDLARVAVQGAAERKIPVVLDCGTWREVFLDLLPLASVAIISEQFELPGRPAASSGEVVAALLGKYPLRLVAVSRGAGTIVWATPAGEGELPVLPVSAVDTLGAGDVLHGAFMHFAFSEGLDDLTALKNAAAVATRSCEHFGTRAGVAASVAAF